MGLVQQHHIKMIIFFSSGILYDTRFMVEQLLESNITVALSAEMNAAPDFAAIAASISGNAELTTAFGKYQIWGYTFYSVLKRS